MRDNVTGVLLIYNEKNKNKRRVEMVRNFHKETVNFTNNYKELENDTELKVKKKNLKTL